LSEAFSLRGSALAQVQDFRVAYLKAYELNNQGTADVRRIFLFSNEGKSDLELERTECRIREERIDLYSFAYYDEEGPIEHERPVVLEGVTELKAYTKSKMIKPGGHYMATFQYSWPEFARKLGRGWFVKDQFVLKADVKGGVEYHVEYKLPPLKPWWKFWQSVKGDTSRDGSPGGYDSQRHTYSWQFGLQPNTCTTIMIFYALETREKLVAFIFTVFGYLLFEGIKRVTTLLLG